MILTLTSRLMRCTAISSYYSWYAIYIFMFAAYKLRTLNGTGKNWRG